MQWSWTLWLVKWAYVLTTTANDKKLCDNWLTTPKNSHTFLYHRKVEIQRKIFDDLPYPSYHTSFPQFKVRDPVINQQLWNLFGNYLHIYYWNPWPRFALGQESWNVHNSLTNGCVAVLWHLESYILKC